MPTPEPRSLAPHLAAGHELIPLHRWDHADEHRGRRRERGKTPVHSNWTRRPYGDFDASAHMADGGNVGVRLRATDLIVDVDPRADDGRWGVPAFDELCLRLGLVPSDWPAVHTGGGGLHLYLTKPDDVSVRDSLPDFPGVEFKTLGRQGVAAGSVHPTTRRTYEWDPLSDDPSEAPACPEALLEAIRRQSARASDAEAGVHTAEELAAMLEALDPEDFSEHDDWLTLMQACHHATAGAGREEFADWSARDPLYADDGADVRLRWDSLDAGREGAVTYRTLHKLMRDAGAEAAIPRPPAEDDFPDDLELDELPVDAASPKAVMAEWVFVADAMKFVRRRDLKQFKPEQWNSLFASLDPEHNLVSRVYKGKTPVRRYESLAYVPSAPEELRGGSTYNIWRPSGIAAREGDVSVIEEHLEYLFPDETERGHVLDFMHFVCVRPEVKVMFAPLIQGEQGTGKTAIGVLLRRIIGAANVAEPSPDELRDKWTKWQEGASLALVEELMTNGRMELANKLKPVITNDTLRIEDKGAPLYSIPNHLNMLCFTNHKNAVRLEAGDRRWLVIFSPAEPKPDAYYKRLWAFIEGRDGPAAWRHHLEGHRPALDPKGRAPMTAAKAEMREASMTDVESTVAEWLASRTGPMANDLFRFEDAWTKLDTLSRPSKASLTMALRAAGCVQHPRQTNPSLPAVVLWSVADHDRWAKAGAAGRTRAWMEMEGFETLEQFNEMN